MLALPLVLYPAKKPNAVLKLPVTLLASAPEPTPALALPVLLDPSPPTAVLELPVVFILSAPTPVAVLAKPVVLKVSAPLPIAVLRLPLVLLTSASAPRKVLKWVPQSSRQTARACGETAKQPKASGMSSKASRTGDRFIECFNGRVVVFINESYEITPRLTRQKTAILSPVYRTTRSAITG